MFCPVRQTGEIAMTRMRGESISYVLRRLQEEAGIDDASRGDLIPLTRVDPLVGTTSFGYDAFNRQSTVTDPNGVETETQYDELDRVRFRIRKGAVPADDLVTEHRYNVFGDLFQTVLPEGNVIEYGYDAAGRMTSIERKPDDQASSHGERIVYTLDGFGHHVSESLQRWNGAQWLEHNSTDYVYSSRCHLDQRIDGSGTRRLRDGVGVSETVERQRVSGVRS